MSDNLYDPYEYSEDFNYDLWTEGTVATLTNVTWDSAYRDVVKFSSRAARDAYIDAESSTLEIENMTYARPNMPVTLPVPINRAQQFNYIRVKNEPIPGSGDVSVRSFYYFIVGVEFASPGATRFLLQLDVFQTYVYDVQFNNCYIERGHIGIANSNAFDGHGRDFLTIPEGLDIGNEYQIIATRSENVMATPTDPWAHTDETRATQGTAVLMAMTGHMTLSPGTENAPVFESSHGSMLQGMPNGTEYYVFKDSNEFFTFMLNYSRYPWVTESVVSVTIIPKPGRYGYGLNKVEIDTDGSDNQLEQIDMYTLDTNGRGNGRWYNMFPNWRDSPEILNKIPERYRHLKKFLTYPYMVIEMTTFSGTPIILKPEVWTDNNARIHERAALVPPNQRIVFMPFRYNAREDADYETYKNPSDVFGEFRTEYGDDGGEYMDMTTQISNFPSMAIVNNGTISFLASNTHSRGYDVSTADWSQQKALRGADVSYGQAKENINATRAQGDTSRNADQASTLIGNQFSTLNAGLSGVQSLLSGNVAGAIPGMASAGLGSAAEQWQNNQQLQNRMAASHSSQDISTGVASYMQDTNRDLAEFAAKGDYHNAIAGINARVQDARLIQPSMSGQSGGEAFNIIHNMSKLSLRWKLAPLANIRANGEHWLRYGYAVQMFADIPESLMCMSNFTYWKLTETYISGRIPEVMKSTIRGILEKGVTAWRSPDIIGKIDIADNEPLGGFAL